ncbi:MAG: hypothetical protein JWN04_252 [Myxococcaceae bacterium]|nr:hypothetical protein [Myxococcaceae bacterium]
MSTGGTAELDHAARAVSTAPSRSSELANWVRYRSAPSIARAKERATGEGSSARPGHVESHFLKANSPDGRRAIWLKHTLLVPRDPARPAVAELWAIAFADGGLRKLAQKRSFPIAEAHFGKEPFRITVPGAELRTGLAAGSVGDGEHQVRWQLRFEASEEAFLPFRYARMYSGPLPRSKSLTPVPDARMHGYVHAFGERWQLDGWRGAQGHNWGQSHAQEYAWVHANAWSEERNGQALEGAWLEALTGRMRVGRVTTPWLSVAGAALDGERYRFDGLSALLSRRLSIAPNRYQLTVEQAGVRLTLSLAADAAQFAGLHYEDPDGSSLTCLNSKLARGTLELTTRRWSRRFYTEQGALELGTREPQRGVAVLV